MKMMRLAPAFGLAFVIAACGTEDRTDTAATVGDTMAVTTSPATGGVPMDTGMAGTRGMAGMESRIQLNPLNNSGHSGEATLNPMGDRMQVTVRLNAPSDRTHPGHIHQGTCDPLGEAVIPLESVTTQGGTGTSTSTVNIQPSTVMNGQHVINYHAPDGTPVACGSIPQHSM